MGTNTETLPKYVCIGKTSHMKLSSTGYETRGWHLPLKSIGKCQKTGNLIIVDFMDHLNGKTLEPITAEQFEKAQGHR